ncbi:uncharacterized protein LOC143220095 [Lasioglossum baleicum]|uniref:uncharacterized protein LOC143220095 n=1 Tax=Lasioglossum baleicum TaxID=434251 RepID=UPI003FCDC280
MTALKKNLKILQINLNHCKMAQNLVTQTANQLGADIVLVSEPWSPQSHWFNDGHKCASIWIPQSDTHSNIQGLYSGKGNVAVRLDSYVVVSCYFSPNRTIEEYKDRIAELENFLNTIDISRCIVAGDFNAKSPAWGSSTLDGHGGIIMEMCNSCELIPTLSQGKFSFEKNGRRTLIDFMLCGKTAAEAISSSRILEEFTASDHRYLLHEFQLNDNKNKAQKVKKRLSIKGFSKLYTELTKIADPLTISTIEDIDSYIQLLEEIFEVTSFYPKTPSRRKEVWWWNADIAALRKLAVSSRRALQRARSKDKPEEEIKTYYDKHKENKKALKIAIMNAKKKSWTNLIDGIEEDIWGKPYKWVMRTVASRPPPTVLSDEDTRRIIETMFQTSPDLDTDIRSPAPDAPDTADDPFTIAEI